MPINSISPSIPNGIDRLRLRQLRLILAIGERASLLQAAAKIHVTQPTATKMLAELEHSLGALLYERTPRGLIITQIGNEVLGFARKVIVEHDRLLTTLAAHAAGITGEVVIGSILGATPDVIVATVLEMKRRQPLLSIKLHGETSDHVLELLEQRVVDVAVGRFSSPDQPQRFDQEILGSETLCFVVRAGHPLLGAGPIGLDELADELWVLQPQSTPTRQMLDQQFRELQMGIPRDHIEVTSILTIMQLIGRSNAIALLSEPSVRDHLSAGILARLPARRELSLPGFGLLTRKGESLSGHSRLFVDVIREIAQREMPHQ